MGAFRVSWRVISGPNATPESPWTDYTAAVRWLAAWNAAGYRGLRLEHTPLRGS